MRYDLQDLLWLRVAVGVAVRRRLLGVRGEQLMSVVNEPGLWDDDGDWREAEHTLDAITAKFGKTLVRPATLLGTDPDRRMPMRGTD
jgi:DNA polymerase-4